MRIILALFLIGQSIPWSGPVRAVSDKIATPNLSAPRFQASADEKREESSLTECDRQADARKLTNYDRFSFIQRCLAGQHSDSSRR
jgi:hypothetical protein